MGVGGYIILLPDLFMDLHEGVRDDHLLEVGRVLQSVSLKRVGGGGT